MRVEMLILLLKKEFLELKRERKLEFLLLIFIFLATFSVALTKFTPKLLELMLPALDPKTGAALFGNLKTPTVIEYISMYHKNMTQMGLIIVALAFNDNITKEIHEKSIYNLLSLGIKRREVILSKSFTMSLSVSGMVLLTNTIFFGFLSVLGIQFGLHEFIILLFIVLSKLLLLISTLTLTSAITLNGWGAAISALGIYAVFYLLVFVPMLKYAVPFYYWNGHGAITISSLMSGLTTLFPWIVLNNACSVYIIKKRDI